MQRPKIEDSHVGHVPHRPMLEKDENEGSIPKDSDDKNDEEENRDNVGLRPLNVRHIAAVTDQTRQVLVRETPAPVGPFPAHSIIQWIRFGDFIQNSSKDFLDGALIGSEWEGVRIEMSLVSDKDSSLGVVHPVTRARLSCHLPAGIPQRNKCQSKLSNLAFVKSLL